MSQPGLFDSSAITVPSTSILGLSVITPTPCHACRSIFAVVGSSNGPHYGHYRCASCDAFLNWMRGETHRFLCDVIDNFGRPAEPIEIRHLHEFQLATTSSNRPHPQPPATH